VHQEFRILKHVKKNLVSQFLLYFFLYNTFLQEK